MLIYCAKTSKSTSTLVGQHSTALLSMILASSGSSSSTAVFHSRTDLDTFSRAAGVTVKQVLIILRNLYARTLDQQRGYRAQ